MSCYYANDLYKDTIVANIAPLTKPIRIPIEQDSDPTLVNFERKMLGLPFDEQVLITDALNMHYFRNKSRTIIKDDVLCRHYYKDLAEVSHSQVQLLGQLLKILQNHYMEQLAHTQAFQIWCKKNHKSITFLPLKHLSETGSVSLKYASKTNT